VATIANLERAKLDECIRSETVDSFRRAERAAAHKLGVVYTPTCPVGRYDTTGAVVGSVMIGAAKPDSLSRLIEAAERTLAPRGRSR
jgi:hypothetical protein